jgi:hypothetical protein
LWIQNFSDTVIDMTGVEMICKKVTRAVEFRQSTNTKIIGLTIDYDPLPFTQGTITSMSTDGRTYTIDLHDGYPRANAIDFNYDKLEIFDKDTDELKTTTYYGVTVTYQSPTRFTVVRPSWYDSRAMEKVGDYAVLRHQPANGIPHAVLPALLTDCTLEGITVYSANMFSFLEGDCSNTRYINCVVDRRPLEIDYATRGHRRLRSGEADAFHSKHAIVGPTYQGCIARYNGDDGVAINGDYHLVVATNGNQLRVLGKGGGKPNLAIGDPLEIVTYDGERLPDAKITNIQETTAPTSAEKTFVANQKFSGSAASSANGAVAYTVTIDRSITLPMGSVIAAGNKIGNGFKVIDCTVGPLRSRGILIKGGDGVISGNRLIGTWMTAIKVAPEYKWLEAGSGNNVDIINNVAVGVRDVAIAAYSNGGDDNWAKMGAHNNVLVKDNVVATSVQPGIGVSSTKGLAMHMNIIKDPNNSLLDKGNVNKWGRDSDPNRDIFIVNSELVEYDPLNDPRNAPGPAPAPGPSPTSTPAPSLRGTAPPTPPPTNPPTNPPPTPPPTNPPPTPPPTNPPTNPPPTNPPTNPPTPSPTKAPTKAPTPPPTNPPNPPTNPPTQWPCATLSGRNRKQCIKLWGDDPNA